MTKSNSTHKFTIAAAFGAAALFSMLSFGSTAEAANVLSCQGSTAGKVISCCEKLVKKNGRPVWMIQEGTSCKKAVVCRGGPNDIAAIALVVKRCYIGRPLEIHEGPGPQGTKRGSN